MRASSTRSELQALLTSEKVGSVPTDLAIVLPPTATVRVAWELIVDGPFERCVVRDGRGYRDVTATRLIHAALDRRWRPSDVLDPASFDLLERISVSDSLADAMSRFMLRCWSVAVIDARAPRLLSARALAQAVDLLVGDLDRAGERDAGEVWAAESRT